MGSTTQDPDAAALATLARLAAGALSAAGTSGGAGEDPFSYAGIKRALRGAATRDPLDTILVTVLGGSYLFYLAEKDANPKVTSFWDALVFISTCLSVGYADVFARTNAGKAIATFVMTLGPAISGSALDPPAAEREPAAPSAAPSPESLEVQKAILARLDAIVHALNPAAPPSTESAPST